VSEVLSEAKLSYNDTEPDIEKIQSQFRILLNDRPLRLILGDDFISQLQEWDEAITKRRSEPFSIVILGDFKRGKSTVINAILGQPVAPVNVAPETFTINSIGYGELPSAEATLKNGQRIKLSGDDLAREKLEKLTAAFPDSLEYIEILNTSEILKGIRIVDTPGLSDLDMLDKQVQDYLVHADAVIYVAGALTPLSETEQLFLASHVRPQSFSKFFVLVNMIDAIDTMEDIEKVIKRISDRCGDIVSDARVYGISAIDEYRRKIGLTRPDIKGFQDFYEDEFLKFETDLKREIILQKDIIRTRRIITMMGLMINDTAARIRMIYEMIDLDTQRLETFSKSLEEECASLSEVLEIHKPKIQLLATEMHQQAEQWMYAFFSKLREEILESRNTASPENLEKYFYRYLIDKVGEAYRKCLEYHRDSVTEYVENMGDALSDKLGLKGLGEVEDVNEESMSLLNMIVSKSVLNAASSGTGGEFPSGVMPQMKKILKRKRQTDIVDIALDNFSEIRENTIKDLKSAYSLIEENALSHLDGVYQARVDFSLEAIRQAKEISQDSGSGLMKKHLGNAAKIIKSCAVILAEYT